MVNQTENDELQSHDKLSAISIGKKKKFIAKQTRILILLINRQQDLLHVDQELDL